MVVKEVDVKQALASLDWARTGDYASRGGTILAPWGNYRPEKVSQLMAAMGNQELRDAVVSSLKKDALKAEDDGNRSAARDRLYFLAGHFSSIAERLSHDKELLRSDFAAQLVGIARKSSPRLEKEADDDIIAYRLEHPERLG